VGEEARPGSVPRGQKLGPGWNGGRQTQIIEKPLRGPLWVVDPPLVCFPGKGGPTQLPGGTAGLTGEKGKINH